MKISVFLVAIVAYVAVCYFSASWFLVLRRRIEGSKPVGFLRFTLAFLVAILFLIPWLAFGIFFPAWLSESMEIVERTPNVTMGFVLFGTAVVAVSTILAGRRQRN
jgi:hypothetical protein